MKKNFIKISSIFNYLILFILSLMFIIPVLTIISVSFSDEKTVLSFGYRIIPQIFSLDAYNMIFSNPMTILNGYKISIAVTLMGSLVGLLISSMCAYSLSRPDFRLRRVITFYLFFTMLFSGGLVPQYILYTQYLHLKNSLLGLILPILVNVFFVIVLRTFFQSLPFSIIESAVIDGAGEYKSTGKFTIPQGLPQGKYTVKSQLSLDDKVVANKSFDVQVAYIDGSQVIRLASAE